jgi:predicted ester cyclase
VVEKNKDMVRRMVEAINEGREDEAVAGLFAPRAARRVGRLFAEFRSAFPDWHEEIVQLVGEGDTVAGRFRCSGTHLGEFLGEAPTGRRMEVEEVFFLRAEGDRFVEFWGLEDSLGRMRQLGLLQ